jgi:hypothetical protein
MINKTKDILHVMQMLGHKNIQTTLVYTHLVSFEGDEFHSAVAETVDEAKKLVEAEFEYVRNHNDTMLFRKKMKKYVITFRDHVIKLVSPASLASSIALSLSFLVSLLRNSEIS